MSCISFKALTTLRAILNGSDIKVAVVTLLPTVLEYKYSPSPPIWQEATAHFGIPGKRKDTEGALVPMRAWPRHGEDPGRRPGCLEGKRVGAAASPLQN